MEFARSFVDAYSFRCLYYAGKFAFPIVGAMRYSCADAPFWTVFERREAGGLAGVGAGVEFEEYAPVGVYPEAGAYDAEAEAAPFAEQAGRQPGASAKRAVLGMPSSEELTDVLDSKRSGKKAAVAAGA